jgi:hypothetical protein
MTSQVPHIRVVMKIKKNDMASLHTRGWAIYNGMEAAGAVFVGANPALPVLLGQLNTFDGAVKATIGRVLAAYPPRDADASILLCSLELERGLVESLCNQSPESAATIASAAGMFIAKSPTRNKAILAATSASGSSAAALVANAGMLKGKTWRRAFFNWRGSPDGGKTWLVYPSTNHAKTTVPNLVALSEWMFEVSITIGTDAAGPWSQVLPTHLVEHLPAVELRAVA